MDKKTKSKTQSTGIVLENDITDIVIVDIKLLKKVQKFMQALHKSPKVVKQLPHKKSVNYTPIAIIENELDELFFGLWQTKNFRYQVIVNEIAGAIDLEVFHPVTGTWITRQGAASVQIRQVKNSSITEINAKIKDAITTDLPHLKAACIKNAAASLGKRFGRNINRDYWEEYSPIIPDEQKQEDITNKIKEKINEQKE